MENACMPILVHTGSIVWIYGEISYGSGILVRWIKTKVLGKAAVLLFMRINTLI